MSATRMNKKTKESKDLSSIKNFNMRIEKDLWMFLKNQAAFHETTMTGIIINCIEKHRKKIESKLTHKDT